MTRTALRSLACFIALASIWTPNASADLWRDATDATLGEETGEWSNKLDLADLDGDGRVDLLFANGGNYNQVGEPEFNRVYLNTGNDADGNPQFKEATFDIMGDEPDHCRAIKARDLDGDGNVDIIVGAHYETQSRLYLGLGDGRFEERTDLFPQIDASVGDIEVGDVDGDGDLDILLADWGLGSESQAQLLDPFTAPGGRTILWLNQLDEEAGAFVDATKTNMPDVLIKWSWELEFIDVDLDFDLDVMVSCKSCDGGFVFKNDGGVFEHDAGAISQQRTNNYDYEPMFLQLPGQDEPSLAVVTINDGPQDDPGNRFDLRERILVADADGKFEDLTGKLWPDSENVGEDDNMVVVLDFDSDSDPDFLIGALGGGPDRLHINDLADSGTMLLSSNQGIETGLTGTPGTLGIALADLNGDGRLDVVQSQGELAEPERVYLGDDIAPDTAAPVIAGVSPLSTDGDGPGRVVARIHDNKSPSRPHDWKQVVMHWAVDGEVQDDIALSWSGEFLWQANVEAPQGEITYEICATDAAGNESCSELLTTEDGGKADDPGAPSDGGDEAGCGCTTSGSTPWGALWALGLLGLRPRRRR